MKLFIQGRGDNITSFVNEIFETHKFGEFIPVLSSNFNYPESKILYAERDGDKWDQNEFINKFYFCFMSDKNLKSYFRTYLVSNLPIPALLYDYGDKGRELLTKKKLHQIIIKLKDDIPQAFNNVRYRYFGNKDSPFHVVRIKEFISENSHEQNALVCESVKKVLDQDCIDYLVKYKFLEQQQVKETLYKTKEYYGITKDTMYSIEKFLTRNRIIPLGRLGWTIGKTKDYLVSKIFKIVEFCSSNKKIVLNHCFSDIVCSYRPSQTILSASFGFIYFIIEHYNSLPNSVVFINSDKEQPDSEKIIKYSAGAVKCGFYYEPDREFIENKWEQDRLGELWELIFENKYPPFFRTSDGLLFSISKKKIREHSVDKYLEILNLMKETTAFSAAFDKLWYPFFVRDC